MVTWSRVLKMTHDSEITKLRTQIKAVSIVQRMSLLKTTICTQNDLWHMYYNTVTLCERSEIIHLLLCRTERGITCGTFEFYGMVRQTFSNFLDVSLHLVIKCILLELAKKQLLNLFHKVYIFNILYQI